MVDYLLHLQGEMKAAATNFDLSERLNWVNGEAGCEAAGEDDGPETPRAVRA